MLMTLTSARLQALRRIIIGETLKGLENIKLRRNLRFNS